MMKKRSGENRRSANWEKRSKHGSLAFRYDVVESESQEKRVVTRRSAGKSKIDKWVRKNLGPLEVVVSQGFVEWGRDWLPLTDIARTL
jgi:hypothetical protein